MADTQSIPRVREFKTYTDYLRSVTGTDKFGWVYFIGPVSGPIKVGYTLNVEERLRGLQTGNHADLFLWAAVEGTLSCERAWHDVLAKQRIRGEWFKLCPAVVSAIQTARGFSSRKKSEFADLALLSGVEV